MATFLNFHQFQEKSILSKLDFLTPFFVRKVKYKTLYILFAQSCTKKMKVNKSGSEGILLPY